VKTHSPKAIKAALGAALRKQRLRAGLSQIKLADRAGIHFTYLADTERGERNIGVVNVVRIARALDVPLDKLFGAVEGELRRGRGSGG
jgi:transcriptional regulator with XRE-family HTH domain